MARFAARWFLLIFFGFSSTPGFAQTAAPHVEPASHRAAHASPIAPLAQQLFGAIPLATKSEEARKSLELAWDKYENAMYQSAAELAADLRRWRSRAIRSARTDTGRWCSPPTWARSLP